MLAFAVLWLGSLALPGVQTYQGSYFGYLLLFIGGLGVLIGTPAWFANPFWLLAAVYAKSKPRRSLLFGVVGLAFAATALFLRNAPADGGVTVPATLGPGFWVWIASAAPLLAAAVAPGFLYAKRAVGP